MNILEIHSREADNGVAGHCGFGCGDFSPDRCSTTDQGFLLYGYILYLPGKERNLFVDFFLVQVYDIDMADEPFNLTSEAAKELSKLGASKGGTARAVKLSADRRREIARAAIQARWEKAGKAPLPRATHKGNFKEDFGIDVDCYVLNDEARTAVISQRGMGEALGLGKSGSRLPRFVAGKAISNFVGPELREKLEQPVIFQAQVGGPETLTQVHGYDVTILIDLCKAVTKAEGEKKLLPHQVNVARQAHIILNASAKAGIKGLVYALAGYDATREETIAAFKLFVQQEARDYEKEFPDQLYVEWYRLYSLPRPERNRPWKFKHLTVDQVYRPLARSNGKILELTKEQRENSNSRWKKLHQFLSEIGVKALRTHLGQLLGIARISKTQDQYEKYFKELFGDQYELF
ncbi:MAG: P63C domain-containing protein [Bryobacteraceae bacterium]